MDTVIRVENLTKTYGEKTAISRLSFEVCRGNTFGLLGANGAGKSTAIECILGTKIKDFGEISVLGLDPVKERRKLYNNIGVQFQDCAYQSLITVSELCELTECVYKRKQPYESLLEEFGLPDKKKSKVSSLSGGERQRLFIVLALIPCPEVVFLDELTTGLDTLARKKVWKHLENLKKEGLTILLTSHYMDEVERLCDKIAVLKKGNLEFLGTTAELTALSKKDTFEDAYEWIIGEKE